MEAAMDRVETIIKRSVEEKICSRLENIVWGVNCNSVREALIFSEEWFLGDFEDGIKEEVEAFLISCGFQPRTKFESRIRKTTWYFPIGELNDFCLQIKNKFEKSFQDEMAKHVENAKEIIYNFFKCREMVVFVKVGNQIFSQIMREYVDLYNQNAQRAVNGGVIDFYRTRMEYIESKSGQSGYLVKNNGDDYATERAKERVKSYIWRDDESYKKWLINNLSKFFYYMILANKKTEKRIRNIRFGVDSEKAEDFMMNLRSLGIECSFFQKMPENEYCTIADKDYSQIWIYIEIEKVTPLNFYSDNPTSLSDYTKFCKLYV